MQIFIYEYTCATAGWSSLPQSLRNEGAAMLAAVLQDFGRINGEEVCTLLADDFTRAMPGTCHRAGGDETLAFRRLAEKADYTLVIAPEFDEILATRCRWVEIAGGRSLNCSQEAIASAADKASCKENWGPPNIELFVRPNYDSNGTLQFEFSRRADATYPGVLKPRYGAGSQHTWRVENLHELQQCLTDLRTVHPCPEMIYTPYIAGMPASVLFLAGRSSNFHLMPVQQILSEDGRFRYLGGKLPLPADLAQRAASIAHVAMDSLPNWFGFVGVDLVLRDAIDNDSHWNDSHWNDWIEINPRLTTSYLGLRQLADFNIAEALLQVVRGETPEMKWKPGPVEFRVE